MTEAVLAVRGNYCCWLYCDSWCADTLYIPSLDLKIAQRNAEHCQIQELIVYKSDRLDYNATEATKNICRMKSKGAVDHSKQIVQEIMLGL